MNVVLWFDTEDYLLPADDDAAKRLADLLSERGIHATFKVVGEKARVLEKRGRRDVIDALKRHTIGYHSNFHSVHPAPAEYLAECGLLDGIEEFVRHEARGAADVRRIFGVPTLACYGQPGSSWAPQAVAGLAQCGIGTDGIPCYLDSGSHVGLRGVPFWYCGVLNVYHMNPNETRMDLWKPDAIVEARKAFTEIDDRLSAQGGGLISIYYHPCEWVHKQFWDSVNFARGANPPREQWKAPPQRSAQETDGAFERFAQYIDFIRSVPGIHFVTAAQLPALYPDRLRSEGAGKGELLELAGRIAGPSATGIDFQTIEGKAFSPADQFALLTFAVAREIRSRMASTAALEPLKVPGNLLGPDSEPKITSRSDPMTLDWFAFRDATLDVEDYLLQHHRMPARVFIGPDPVAPADFLVGLARAYSELAQGNNVERVVLGKDIAVLTMRRVAPSELKLYGGWVIHRQDFQAPHLVDVTRLQAWTLKPATAAQTK